MTCNKFFFTWQITTTGKAVLRDILSIMAREWHKIFELRFKNIYLKCTRGFHLSSRSQNRRWTEIWQVEPIINSLQTIFPSQTTLWLTRSSLKDHFFGRNSFEDLQYRSQTQSTMNTEYIFMKGKRDRGTMKKNKL